MDYVIKASFGNDSIALIQWMAEQGHHDAYVLHNDTGWAREGWSARVDAGEAFARRLGMTPVRTASIGFVAAARLKRAFPRSGMQFCTTMLKIEPSLSWLDQVDPQGNLTAVVGIRREESSKRANWPEDVEDSPMDGGRRLWAPLVRTTEVERDALVLRAGFEVLPHRSKECWPCVNAPRADLRDLARDPERIAVIRDLEEELSVDKDVRRRMFRRQGSIDETIAWAQSKPGTYVEGQQDMFDCDAGWCGS